MENEQILTVVAAIAVVAVIGRIIINRQQSGRPINWPKIAIIAVVGSVFVSVMLTIDSYRLVTRLAGSVDEAADLREAHVVGRKAGSVVPLADSTMSGLPLYFALDLADARETGYWMMKEGDASATTRQILESESDPNRTAVKRTTSAFPIMRNPSDPDDYLPICLLTLRSGEKVLGVMAQYDAHEGQTPVMTSKPSSDKMREIALKAVEADSAGTVATDVRLNDMVYVSAFDSQYYASSQAHRLLAAALVALVAAAAAGCVIFTCFRPLLAKHKKRE